MILLGIGSLLLTSCTTLQWRETDEEIRSRFAEKQIPTSISYFEIDSLDLKIRVQKVAQNERQFNLMFFHGSPSSLSAWNAYLADTSLVSKANLYAVDRPGYGYSNFGDEMTSIDLQARVMNALIHDFQLENVVVIGSSYGGPLVARMAVDNNNIKAVIMISPAIDPRQEKKIWASRLTQWWITRWLVPTGYRVAGDEKTTHAAELMKIENDWDKVGVPVLHIHGDIDDIVPYGNVNYTRERFSDIRIITTPETGHEIAWGRPDLIKPYLYQLLEELSGEK
ncbi:MAG: alpha/beta hydrolase [Bacteroidota bacterium]